MSNPERIEIADSPISLWLITEASGRQYTIHRHQLASNVAQDPDVKVHALTVVATEAAAMAATVPDIVFTDEMDCTHHWSHAAATEFMRKFFNEWPGGMSEVESALRTAKQAPVAGQPAEPSPAARDVLAERARQITECGHDYAHDDSHTDGQIADEAGLYLLRGQYPMKHQWCWKHKHPASEKRVPRRTQLVIGAALAIAEIERIDRAAPKGDSNG